MKLILLENVNNLGKLGDQVRVKPGYGRNYLLPQSKAIIANKSNVEMFEKSRAEYEAVAATKLSETQKRAQSLDGVELVVFARVSEEDKLYGSVGTAEIVETASSKGLVLHKQEIVLPDGPFRLLGEYDVKLVLSHHVEAKIRLVIKAVA